MNAPRRPPQEVRLIGGTLRRSKLPVADVPGLRPTPDRVRETLFNWLGADLSGWRVLDAFAGSGALGFEAASRGAAAVQLIERDAGLVRHLKASAERLQVTDRLRVLGGDALAWMRRAPAQGFELVLLDPPFDAPALLGTAIDAALPLLVDDGWLYVEAPAELDLARLPQGLKPWRQGRAGAVFYHLLQRSMQD